MLVSQGQIVQTTCNLIVMECHQCHCLYGMSKDLYDRARDNSGVEFFCSNGHGAIFCETKVQRLTKELECVKESAEARLRELESTRKINQCLRGVVTRTKNRIKKGVCPCCNRYFKNVHRHMLSKHPDKKIKS